MPAQRFAFPRRAEALASADTRTPKRALYGEMQIALQRAALAHDSYQLPNTSSTSVATRSPIARHAVRPGDSIPTA
jgi:hypothetical protein